jgi:formylglycine-generating enzyme required for sulfatase activity
VGRKRPNDFGFFDVLGNLLEWCYNPDPTREDRCDRPVPGGADCRKIRLASVRGGSYSQPEGGLTVVGYSPTLDRLYADEALRYIGFRVARTEP